MSKPSQERPLAPVGSPSGGLLGKLPRFASHLETCEEIGIALKSPGARFANAVCFFSSRKAWPLPHHAAPHRHLASHTALKILPSALVWFQCQPALSGHAAADRLQVKAGDTVRDSDGELRRQCQRRKGDDHVNPPMWQHSPAPRAVSTRQDQLALSCGLTGELSVLNILFSMLRRHFSGIGTTRHSARPQTGFRRRWSPAIRISRANC